MSKIKYPKIAILSDSRPRRSTDRTEACGASNRGSIPLEGTIVDFWRSGASIAVSVSEILWVLTSSGSPYREMELFIVE